MRTQLYTPLALAREISTLTLRGAFEERKPLRMREGFWVRNRPFSFFRMRSRTWIGQKGVTIRQGRKDPLITETEPETNERRACHSAIRNKANKQESLFPFREGNGEGFHTHGFTT